MPELEFEVPLELIMLLLELKERIMPEPELEVPIELIMLLLEQFQVMMPWPEPNEVPLEFVIVLKLEAE